MRYKQTPIRIRHGIVYAWLYAGTLKNGLPVYRLAIPGRKKQNNGTHILSYGVHHPKRRSGYHQDMQLPVA